MVNRQPVGAHYGLKDWIGQRATAVYMAVYTVIFAVCALTLPEFTHEAWSGLFSGGLFRFLSFLFFVSLFTFFCEVALCLLLIMGIKKLLGRRSRYVIGS